MIRSRFKLFRKVKAITAEARWSGWFLSIFPIVALLLVQVVQPEYYDRVADHPLFVPGADPDLCAARHEYHFHARSREHQGLMA